MLKHQANIWFLVWLKTKGCKYLSTLSLADLICASTHAQNQTPPNLLESPTSSGNLHALMSPTKASEASGEL